jgi:hypothetical protein
VGRAKQTRVQSKRRKRSRPQQFNCDSSASAKQLPQRRKLLLLRTDVKEDKFKKQKFRFYTDRLPDLNEDYEDLYGGNLQVKAEKSDVSVSHSDTVNTIKHFPTAKHCSNISNRTYVKCGPQFNDDALPAWAIGDRLTPDPGKLALSSHGQVTSMNKTVGPCRAVNFRANGLPHELDELRSRRYVSPAHGLSSHSALKHSYNSQNTRDNSSAKPVYRLSSDSELLIRTVQYDVELLPNMIRQLTLSTELPGDLTQVWLLQLATSEGRHAVALYESIKQRVLYNPPVNLHIDVDCVLKSMRDQSEKIHSLSKSLIAEYIISIIELQLLHYHINRTRANALNSVTSVDSSFFKWLSSMATTTQCDVDVLYFLQRTVAAAGIIASKLGRCTDEVPAALMCIYEANDHPLGRSRLISTICHPHHRFSVSRQLLLGRCTDKSSSSSTVNCLADVVPAYLGSRFDSDVVKQSTACGRGSLGERVEDFLALLVTAVESFINMRRGQC